MKIRNKRPGRPPLYGAGTSHQARYNIKRQNEHKRPEVWEEIRGGMGKVWRRCLGRRPGVGKGIRSGGHEESSGPELKKEEGAEEG